MTTPNKTSKITGEVVELRAGHLDDQQLARAEALDRARKVLTAKGFASDGAADAMDLIHVAGWIIDGRDPWAEDSEPDTFRMAVRAATDAAVDHDTEPEPAPRIEFWDMRDGWTKYGEVVERRPVKFDDGRIGLAVYGSLANKVLERAEHTMLRIGAQVWRVERVERFGTASQHRVNVTARRHHLAPGTEIPFRTIVDDDQIGSVTA